MFKHKTFVNYINTCINLSVVYCIKLTVVLQLRVIFDGLGGGAVESDFAVVEDDAAVAEVADGIHVVLLWFSGTYIR